MLICGREDIARTGTETERRFRCKEMQHQMAVGFAARACEAVARRRVALGTRASALAAIRSVTITWNRSNGGLRFRFLDTAGG
jgi:hypothetical protein